MMRPVQVIRFAMAMVGAAIAPAAALASGATNYAARCSMCHQPSGAGLPGQFPRLAGRAAQIASSPDGRAYLAKVLLFGLYGPIRVDDTPITGLMPPVGTMTDQDIADLLNHVVALSKVGKPTPTVTTRAYTAAEVAKVRAQGILTSAGVATLRAELAAGGVIP